MGDLGILKAHLSGTDCLPCSVNNSGFLTKRPVSKPIGNALLLRVALTFQADRCSVCMSHEGADLSPGLDADRQPEPKYYI